MSMDQAPVVLITGASQGLGFAIAQCLLREGFMVSLCARTKSTLETAAMQLRQYGTVSAFVGDVADETFQRRWIQSTLSQFGRIDALVNNASTLGITPMPSIVASTTANERHVFDVNVFAPVSLMRLVAPVLAKQRRSLLLGISSDAAVAGYPGWGIYGASKAALDLLHKSLAAETASAGMQVHSVDPGDMDTTMHHDADPGAEGLRDPVEVAELLMPLFVPLLGEKSWPFLTGARLQVQDDALVEVN
ncbi:SDR family NAD(P)-dependent oxidoreductase [Alicyclobacillus dauci]|uniref:SDR family oxidoreductase n=1 Tax=Alicyclobacillus dauci TaxID=1475485 RepID=A0ABY6Z066_9BACL|nr:SDR family oxidoreductase [Alicyclobacillus dauci]WAH36227.1 SDR family oxidoreductase [Alicyclobacillus dauci]